MLQPQHRNRLTRIDFEIVMSISTRIYHHCECTGFRRYKSQFNCNQFLYLDSNQFLHLNIVLHLNIPQELPSSASPVELRDAIYNNTFLDAAGSRGLHLLLANRQVYTKLPTWLSQPQHLTSIPLMNIALQNSGYASQLLMEGSKRACI
jgi:hypothetical protein